MNTMTKTTLLLFTASILVSLAGCDDAVDYAGPALGEVTTSCQNNEFASADGECQPRSYSVKENTDYSRYREGGSAAFVIEGADANALDATLNGSAVDPVVIGSRLFISLPLGTPSEAVIVIGDADAESTRFERDVERAPLLESSEVRIRAQEDETKTYLEATEVQLNRLDVEQPAGLLEASEVVGTGITERVELLEAEEVKVAAQELDILKPIMLQSQEVSKSDEDKSFQSARARLNKQAAATCSAVIDDLNRVNDVLSFEAGSMLAIATPLGDDARYGNAAAFLVGVGWAYWVDDMLAFLSGVDQFAQLCATVTYEATIDGRAPSTELLPLGTDLPFAVNATREFTDDASDTAKRQLKPLIDAVMGAVGPYFGGFEVNADYLDQRSFTTALSSEDLSVSLPVDSGLTAELSNDGDASTIRFTADASVTGAVETTLSITDTTRDETLDVDVTIAPVR